MTAAALLFVVATSRADVPVFKLGLEDAVVAALATSDRLRAAEHDLAAARARASGAGSLMWPRLSVDANWRYVGVIPSLSVVPGRPAIEFGAHDNWSVGPAASWVIWDWGSTYLSWRGARAAADAAGLQVSLVRRQVRLSACAANAAVQTPGAGVRRHGDSVSLAATQYADIGLRLRAGEASRLDVLQAHQAVLARQREFAAARTALAGAIQDLVDIAGISATVWDTSFPLDDATAIAPPAGTPAATVVAALDPLEASVNSADAAAASLELDPAHPSVSAPARLADAARNAARGITASRLPALVVSGSVARQYPNGPVLEDITQKTVGVAASLPLFEGFRRVRAIEDQREQALSLDGRRDAAAADHVRDWTKARDALAGLRVQRAANKAASEEAAELARLTYDAYKTGAARLIEVQTANLGVLQARVQEARTKAEMMIQLALIRSLAKEVPSR